MWMEFNQKGQRGENAVQTLEITLPDWSRVWTWVAGCQNHSGGLAPSLLWLPVLTEQLFILILLPNTEFTGERRTGASSGRLDKPGCFLPHYTWSKLFRNRNNVFMRPSRAGFLRMWAAGAGERRAALGIMSDFTKIRKMELETEVSWMKEEGEN